MREIKFRGQTCDTPPHWVFGDLYHYTTGEPAINYTHPHKKWLESEPVRPETVGQYTGLEDSNGKEIYEGDIVEISPQFSAKQGLKREFHLSAVVRWDERLARFVVISKEILDSIPDSEFVSVIGNIHDNPELLEVEV